MKKVLFSLAMALTSVAMVHANVIWSVDDNEGESWQVTWDNALHISADQFANARVGNVIKVTIPEVVGIIELKSEGEFLPYWTGKRFTEDDQPAVSAEYEWMIQTATAIDALQNDGLWLCGPNIKITQVELLDGKTLREEGTTIWTGFFWMSDWTTLTIYKNVLERENDKLNDYVALRCYHECPENDFFIQFLGAFDNQDAFIASSTDGTGRVQFKEGYVELDLTAVDLMGKINAVADGNLLIQVNDQRESKGFNFTDVVLVPKSGPTTGIESTTVAAPVHEGIYDLLGRRLNQVETTGIYIINGKKTFVVK